tara:strand:- start:472 stop:669 length:198 start_codon:yes stop_codon:yes gene_type:complete
MNNIRKLIQRNIIIRNSINKKRIELKDNTGKIESFNLNNDLIVKSVEKDLYYLINKPRIDEVPLL